MSRWNPSRRNGSDYREISMSTFDFIRNGIEQFDDSQVKGNMKLRITKGELYQLVYYALKYGPQNKASTEKMFRLLKEVLTEMRQFEMSKHVFEMCDMAFSKIRDVFNDGTESFSRSMYNRQNMKDVFTFIKESIPYNVFDGRFESMELIEHGVVNPLLLSVLHNTLGDELAQLMIRLGSDPECKTKNGKKYTDFPSKRDEPIHSGFVAILQKIMGDELSKVIPKAEASGEYYYVSRDRIGELALELDPLPSDDEDDVSEVDPSTVTRLIKPRPKWIVEDEDGNVSEVDPSSVTRLIKPRPKWVVED
jgi:hypothetical protein